MISMTFVDYIDLAYAIEIKNPLYPFGMSFKKLKDFMLAANLSLVQ